MSKSISCHVRLRPSNAADGPVVPDGNIIQGNKISALNVHGNKRYHFEFERCHGSDSTQEEVFQGVQPLLEQVWRGVNTTIFAYGVTGAGKTHTMQGTKEEPGLVPRIIKDILHKQTTSKSVIDVTMSYVEILKDEVYDLLGTQNEARKKDIRMSAGGQNVVADLIYQPITSWKEFEAIYDAASRRRKTASTKLNSSSSRSHAVLTIYLHITHDSGGETEGKICLTDLAGSENNNLTGNDRERMRESSAINTSLTTLGKVVDALNVIAQRKGDASGVFVPYRESKLTRILQDALGGASQGLLICCLAPGEKFARDTINTLQFGKKSKSVENRLIENRRDSRRLSSISQPSTAKIVKPQAPFKIHTGTDAVAFARPTLGKTVLSSVDTNISHLKPQQGSLSKKSKVNDTPGITEKELQERAFAQIQKIVTQEMAVIKEKEQQNLEPKLPPSQLRHELVIESASGHTTDLSMSQEEKDKRAKIIVNHARKLHQQGDIAGALNLYLKAFEYVPQNRKLSDRITEMQLALEGILPPPQLSSRTDKERAASKSHLKRSRLPLGSGSLAELSYEEETDDATPYKKRRGDGTVQINMALSRRLNPD